MVARDQNRKYRVFLSRTKPSSARGDSLSIKPREVDMARGEQRSNREKKKPKKATIKTIAAAPSQKGAAAGWQPNLTSGKKK